MFSTAIYGESLTFSPMSMDGGEFPWCYEEKHSKTDFLGRFIPRLSECAVKELVGILTALRSSDSISPVDPQYCLSTKMYAQCVSVCLDMLHYFIVTGFV